MGERDVPAVKTRDPFSIPGAQIYASQIGQLSVDRHGVLRYSSPEDETPVRRLCVPADLQRTIIRNAHEGTGHFAVEKMVELLSRRFYFPHMRKMVDLVLKGCQSCQKKGTDHYGSEGHPGVPQRRLPLPTDLP